MSWERDPATGLWKQYNTLIAPAPGSLENTEAPPSVHAGIESATLDAKTIDAIYRAILRHTWAGLGRDERVFWPGLCTWSRVWIAGKWGESPRTGDSLWVPGHWRLRIDMAKKTRDVLNGTTQQRP